MIDRDPPAFSLFAAITAILSWTEIQTHKKANAKCSQHIDIAQWEYVGNGLS